MGDFFDAVKDQAVKNALDRQKDDKKGGGGGRGRGAEKDEADELIKSLMQELAVLRETDPVKKKMLEYADQLADATAEQRAQVQALVETLDRARNGWEAVGRSLMEYAEDAKRIGGDIGEALVGAFEGGEDAVVEFVKTGKLSFADLVTSLIADLARLAARSFIMAPIANAFGGLLGNLPGAGSGGFLDSVISSLSNYDGGGHTGYGPRTGGLDGKGGFLAMLHPQERVVDEARGQSAGGDRYTNLTMNVYPKDYESFRRGRAQLASDAQRMLLAGRRVS